MVINQIRLTGVPEVVEVAIANTDVKPVFVSVGHAARIDLGFGRALEVSRELKSQEWIATIYPHHRKATGACLDSWDHFAFRWAFSNQEIIHFHLQGHTPVIGQVETLLKQHCWMEIRG